MEQTNSAFNKQSPLVSASNKLPKTLSYFISYIALGFVMAVIGPTLPSLAEQTATKLSKISILFTAQSTGYLFGSLMSGYLYDRLKGHPIISASLFIISAMLFLIPFSSWLCFLIGLLFLLGIAQGWLDVGGNTLLVWVHGEKVGPFMSGLHFFFGLGALLAPIIVARTVMLSDNINWAYWTLAIAVFPIALVFTALKSPEIRKPPSKDESRRSNAVLVVLITLFFFLHVGAEISFGGWIYSYGLYMGIAQETGAAYLTSAFWGSFTLSRLLSIPVSMKLKPRTMLIIDIVGGLTASIIILAGSRSRFAVWTGTILMGFSIASLFPTSINFAERNMHISGKVTSCFLVGSSVGIMFFPWFIGQFFESFGPLILPIVILSAFATALLLLWITLYYVSRNVK